MTGSTCGITARHPTPNLRPALAHGTRGLCIPPSFLEAANFSQTTCQLTKPFALLWYVSFPYHEKLGQVFPLFFFSSSEEAALKWCLKMCCNRFFIFMQDELNTGFFFATLLFIYIYIKCIMKLNHTAQRLQLNGTHSPPVRGPTPLYTLWKIWIIILIIIKIQRKYSIFNKIVNIKQWILYLIRTSPCFKLASIHKNILFNLVTVQYIGTYTKGDNIFRMLYTQRVWLKFKFTYKCSWLIFPPRFRLQVFPFLLWKQKLESQNKIKLYSTKKLQHTALAYINNS